MLAIKRISFLGVLFILFSCAEKETIKESSEQESKSNTDKEAIHSSTSTPKSSPPLTELEPVKESERNNELRTVPNQDALKEIQERKNKKEEEDKKEDPPSSN